MPRQKFTVPMARAMRMQAGVERRTGANAIVRMVSSPGVTWDVQSSHHHKLQVVKGVLDAIRSRPGTPQC